LPGDNDATVIGAAVLDPVRVVPPFELVHVAV
jgi:hypothetical protein